MLIFLCWNVAYTLSLSLSRFPPLVTLYKGIVIHGYELHIVFSFRRNRKEAMFRYHRHRLTPTQVGIACWSVHPARTETREREYHCITAYEENKADTTKLESCYHPLFPTASTSSSSFKSPTPANLDFWSETPLLRVGGRDGPLRRPRRARFHNPCVVRADASQRATLVNSAHLNCRLNSINLDANSSQSGPYPFDRSATVSNCRANSSRADF